MKQELRTQLQHRIGEIITANNRNGIVRASIRCGKTRIGLQSIKLDEQTLVCYPKLTIKQAWEDEISKIYPWKELIKVYGVNKLDLEYSSFASLKKLITQGKKFPYIIVDEIHKLSPKNRSQIKQLLKTGGGVLGLTGTLRLRSQKALEAIGIPVIVEFDLEDSINDNLVKDYKLFIHFIELDSINQIKYDELTRRLEYFKLKVDDPDTSVDEKKASDLGFKKYRGLQTNFLYNSPELTAKALELKTQFINKKVLFFSLRTQVADELSNKSYHSENRDTEALEEFLLSEDGHLSTVNMISEGITINNLNTIICHTITSNTEDFQQKIGRGLQLGEQDGEVCQIHAICLKDTIQERWIELSCKSLSQFKISYMFGSTIGSIPVSKIEYLSILHKDKQLHLYKGSYCYPSSVNEQGYQMYKFLGDSDKEYSIRQSKLIKL